MVFTNYSPAPGEGPGSDRPFEPGEQLRFVERLNESAQRRILTLLHYGQSGQCAEGFDLFLHLPGAYVELFCVAFENPKDLRTKTALSALVTNAPTLSDARIDSNLIHLEIICTGANPLALICRSARYTEDPRDGILRI